MMQEEPQAKEVRRFACPILATAANNKTFRFRWQAGQTWGSGFEVGMAGRQGFEPR